MLTELCQELHNWFDRERRTGTFTIENGNLTADFLAPGQYFRIMGSIFSDGVHQFPCDDLPPETFSGEVWTLAIPREFVRDAETIEAWRAKNETADSVALSPFQSENWGGYSYNKANSSNANSGGCVPVWKTVFAPLLNKWRKM